MMTEQQMRAMMEMFANPAYQQGASEFFKIAQQQGMEAARKFWGGSFDATAFPGAEQMMERMADFYSSMGFVTVAKHEEIARENASLKAENQLLRDSIRELQQSFVAENGAKAQQAWQEMVDKQMAMSSEVAKSFFDVFKQPKTPQ